jgi:hypothetical protein
MDDVYRPSIVCQCISCRETRRSNGMGMTQQGSSLKPAEGEQKLGAWQQVKDRRTDRPAVPMLHRAEELINGARQQDYGDQLRNFGQIADFWNAHLKYKLSPGNQITAEDVALMMINLKQARLGKSPTHADSVLDIAGYIGCYDKILDERMELNKRNTDDDIGKMYR